MRDPLAKVVRGAKFDLKAVQKVNQPRKNAVIGGNTIAALCNSCGAPSRMMGQVAAQWTCRTFAGNADTTLPLQNCRQLTHTPYPHRFMQEHFNTPPEMYPLVKEVFSSMAE